MIKTHKIAQARDLEGSIFRLCQREQLTEADAFTVSGLAGTLFLADNEQDANDGHFTNEGKTSLAARRALAFLADADLAMPDLAPSLAAVLDILDRTTPAIWQLSKTVQLAKEQLAQAQAVAAKLAAIKLEGEG